MVSIKNKWIIKSIYLVSILYLVFYVTEFIGLGLPPNYFFGLDDDILISKWGSGTKIINKISPYIYVCLRVFIGVMLFMAYNKHVNFKKLKAEFEFS